MPANPDKPGRARDPSAKNDAAYTVRIALTDITEQIQARAAIQEAREFAESIVDTVARAAHRAGQYAAGRLCEPFVL